MQQPMADLLKRRKDRSLAIILGVKERECDKDLSAMSSQKLRKVILDQVNEFYSLAVDLLESFDDNSEVVLNEHYLEKLDQMYDVVVRNGEGKSHGA